MDVSIDVDVAIHVPVDVTIHVPAHVVIEVAVDVVVEIVTAAPVHAAAAAMTASAAVAMTAAAHDLGQNVVVHVGGGARSGENLDRLGLRRPKGAERRDDHGLFDETEPLHGPSFRLRYSEPG